MLLNNREKYFNFVERKKKWIFSLSSHIQSFIVIVWHLLKATRKWKVLALEPVVTMRTLESKK